MRLRVECGFGKSPKYEVKNWLENIQKIIHDAENIECSFESGKCFSRARLSKLVDKKIEEAKEYQRKGNSFNSLVIAAPPTGGIILPSTALAGETAAKKDMEEIWGYLMGNEFTNVIWVTVSQTVDLVKLQKEIAVALNERFHETEDVKRRAGMLLEMLRRRRFALILDDVWEKISLEELGIPEPAEENGYHGIPKDELVDCWIAEGLVDEMVNLQVNNCLLLESLDDEGRSFVKRHDDHVHYKQKSFVHEKFLQVCLQIVKFFQLYFYKTILSESFFSRMQGLKILNLSGTWIESLPNSVSELTNLTALLLRDCGQLKRVPSLARLRALENLEMLANLKSRYLFSSELRKIPAGILPKLCHLQRVAVEEGN
ncbi:hypothetical protein Ddye_027178 [Dipteronia dyeriana]|uniref:NB-ARC domain-containing protein n=1 Tax=Dipteronia dyeriana TaxID=168575 RepID=A0AAD9TPF4_9ROSI|nr:hypothetical protein Ddye_027178 [Dipteronia dyeriana]